MIHFLHISMQLQGDVDTDALKAQLNKAIDWMHYMPNCWIVLTSADATRWYERLASLLGDSDFVMILPVDLRAGRGWLPHWVVDWMEAAKKKAISLAAIPASPEAQKQIPSKS